MTNRLQTAIQKAVDELTALSAKTYAPDIRTVAQQAESALAALDTVHAAHRITNIMLVELARVAGELGNYDLTETDAARITINEGLADALHEAHEWAIEHEEAEDEIDPDEIRDMRDAYDDAMFEHYRDRRNEMEDV